MSEFVSKQSRLLCWSCAQKFRLIVNDDFVWVVIGNRGNSGMTVTVDRFACYYSQFAAIDSRSKKRRHTLRVPEPLICCSLAMDGGGVTTWPTFPVLYFDLFAP